MNRTAFKILLLEDSEMDTGIITQLLNRLDFPYVLTRVATKEEFELTLSESNPDLVLSDYRIPGYSGFEAMKRVLTTSPDSIFVFVTSSTSSVIAGETILNQVDGFVLKSELKTLVPTINEIIASKVKKSRNIETSDLEAKQRLIEHYKADLERMERECAAIVESMEKQKKLLGLNKDEQEEDGF